MVLGMTNYGYAVNADDGFSFAGYTDEQLVKTYNELKDLPPYINGWGERQDACKEELNKRGIEIA